MKRVTAGRNRSRQNTAEEPDRGVNVRRRIRRPATNSPTRRITRSQCASREGSQLSSMSQRSRDRDRVNNTTENEPLVLVGNGQVETLTQNQEDTIAPTSTSNSVNQRTEPIPQQHEPRLMARTTVSRQLRRSVINVEMDQASSESSLSDFETDMNSTIDISSDDEGESNSPNSSTSVLYVTDDSVVSSPVNESGVRMQPVNYPRYVEDSVVVLGSSEDEDNVENTREMHPSATNNNVSITVDVDGKDELAGNRSGSTESLNWQCPVCLSSMNQLKTAEITLVSTVCGHIFCANCADKFMKTRNDDLPPGEPTMKSKPCPVCRKPITRKSVHPIYL